MASAAQQAEWRKKKRAEALAAGAPPKKPGRPKRDPTQAAAAPLVAIEQIPEARRELRPQREIVDMTTTIAGLTQLQRDALLRRINSKPKTYTK